MGRIFLLDNTVQTYAWGSRTAIAELTGRANDADEPQAELWIGAHPRGPSKVLDGDDHRPLRARIAEAPEAWLGPTVADRFGQLPFLVKVLAAAEPLSIQCHPSAAEARAGFEREDRAGVPLDAPNRTYRDPNAKPELLCALTKFRALKGFRPVEDVRRDLAALGVPAADGDDIESMYRAVMTGSAADKRALAERVTERARSLDGPNFGVIAELAERYPGDVGVISPAFLELVELEPGEAIFSGACELHAYLEGVGVEIMANSDNVIRGGLTKKHVDVDELLRIVDFKAPAAPSIRPKEVSPGVATFETPAAEFVTTIVDVPAAGSHRVENRASIDVLLATEGAPELVAGERTVLAKGAAAVVPASVPSYTIEGTGRVYRTTVPV